MCFLLLSPYLFYSMYQHLTYNDATMKSIWLTPFSDALKTTAWQKNPVSREDYTKVGPVSVIYRSSKLLMYPNEFFSEGAPPKVKSSPTGFVDCNVKH